MSAISVIVPIYNMAEHVHPLWVSLLNSHTLPLVDEVIFVDDGSTDSTAAAVEALRPLPGGQKVRLVQLPSNQGRFRARWAGSKAAKSQVVLFIDARVVLKEDFGLRLPESLKHGQFIQPQPLVDVKRNWFCLYWERSHRWLFSHHYRGIAKGPVELTAENYDQFLKGTTALLAPRELFNSTCHSLEAGDVFSDDTLVMRKMVDVVPLRLDPQLLFWWIPRESFWAFLGRLADRGPGLVEYHVFIRRGWIFYSIFCGLIFLFAVGFSLIWFPYLAALLVLVGILGTALTALLMAESPLEWLRLLPLHFAVVFSVGIGVLYGLAFNTRRWIKGEFRHLKT